MYIHSHKFNSKKNCLTKLVRQPPKAAATYSPTMCSTTGVFKFFKQRYKKFTKKANKTQREVGKFADLSEGGGYLLSHNVQYHRRY